MRNLAHGGDRNLTEPPHTRSDVVTAEPASNRDQPPERGRHRDGHSLRQSAARQRHPAMDAPSERGPTEHLQTVGQLVVGGGRAREAGRPHDHLAAGPRRLQPNFLVDVDVDVGVGRPRAGGLGAVVQPVVHGPQPGKLLSKVGDDLLPLGPGQTTDRLEPGLGVVQQLLDHTR